VLFQNIDGTVTDWLGRPDGTFTGNGGKFSVNLGTAWHVVGTGDFNGDGRADVLFQNTDGTVTDWLGRADGTFTGNAGKFSVNIGAAWHVVGTGDFNGDGYDDILWRSDGGIVHDWLGQANGAFHGNVANLNITVPADWVIAATGDYNGDGYSDVLWRNMDGTLQDWLGQSNGGFIGNVANLNFNPGVDFQVQPNPTGAGLWDY
jgi:FG-GAP-like repeat/FG-GAP repeat